MAYSQIDRNQVSFYLFPVNNNRTAWRPIGLPIMMVVPRRKIYTSTYQYIQVENSDVQNVSIYIENVAQDAYVVGQDHILKDGSQLRYPAREQYRIVLSDFDLKQLLLSNEVLNFKDPAGNPVEFEDVVPGDFFEYTMSTGVTETIPYFKDADYYDLSSFKIEVEILPPNYYNLVYSAEFYYRTTDNSDSSFLCLQDQVLTTATFRFGIDHPGHVMHEMYRLTPQPYLTDASKAHDTTVDFYRPFSDIINDVYDEQALLGSINWVNKTPLEFIPYVAYIIGWELPYFPQTQGAKSLDAIRRAITRSAVYFQNIKGSYRALSELFEIFGLTAYAERLYYSNDGSKLIRPNETLPDKYATDFIKATVVGQVDLLTNVIRTTEGTQVYGGFKASDAANKILRPSTNELVGAKLEIDTNLLFTPTATLKINNTDIIGNSNELTILAYSVTNDSAADLYLQSINAEVWANPTDFDQDLILTASSILASSKIYPVGTDGQDLEGLKGKSEIRLSGTLGRVVASRHYYKGIPDALNSPLNDEATYDTHTNKISLTYNGYVDADTTVYVYALYTRTELDLPSQLNDLQSPFFDMQVITKGIDQQVDPKTLSFALTFLRKVQAFHSIVNLIRTSAELSETYEVNDLSIGGGSAQRGDTDIGRLQVPQAIIPQVGCGDPISLGYKPTDINLRLKKLSNLSDEHTSQFLLNGRLDEDINSRIAPLKADKTSPTGEYAEYNQNIIKQGRTEEIQTVLHPNPNANSQAYGTQVNLPLSAKHDTINSQVESASTNRDSSSFGSFTIEKRAKPTPAVYPLDNISDYSYRGRVDDAILYRLNLDQAENIVIGTVLKIGTGVYYTFPKISRKLSPNHYSSGAKKSYEEYYITGKNRDYFTTNTDGSYLSRLLRAYKTDGHDTIHFTNRPCSYNPDAKANQAYQRPSINIEKPTMHLPGCRFPVIGRMENDYTTDNITARPWDDAFNNCNDKSRLNAILSDDKESLVYDDVSYVSHGNGKIADILNLGYNQTLDAGVEYTSDDVIHAVYCKSASSLYVTLDQVDDSGPSTINTSSPLFSSAVPCSTDFVDYSDGYKASYGVISHNYYSESDYGDVFSGLDLLDSGTVSGSFLFTLSSGILSETGKRLDIGSTVAPCETQNYVPFNVLKPYSDSLNLARKNSDTNKTASGLKTIDLNRGGLATLVARMKNDVTYDINDHDFSADKVNIVSRLSNVEMVNADSITLNGLVNNLMELV